MGYASFIDCTHLWDINNSSMHLNPRCRNKAGLETFLEKLQYFSDWHNTQHDQETVLAERTCFTKVQQNVILRCVELYPEGTRSTILNYCNKPIILSLSIHKLKVGQGLTRVCELKLQFQSLGYWLVIHINPNTVRVSFASVLNSYVHIKHAKLCILQYEYKVSWKTHFTVSWC